MVVSVILLIVIFIVCAAIISFLAYILVPAVKNQTKISEDLFVSDKEVSYTKPFVSKDEASKKVAVVLCSEELNSKERPVLFNKGHSCAVVNSIYGNGSDYLFSCIGLGDCQKVCPQNAIFIENSTAIISGLCIGCGKCVEVCPRKLIKLIPNTQNEVVLSVNYDETKENKFTTEADKTEVKKIERPLKKGFKIWAFCYKIVERLEI